MNALIKAHIQSEWHDYTADDLIVEQVTDTIVTGCCVLIPRSQSREAARTQRAPPNHKPLIFIGYRPIHHRRNAQPPGAVLVGFAC